MKQFLRHSRKLMGFLEQEQGRRRLVILGEGSGDIWVRKGIPDRVLRS